MSKRIIDPKETPTKDLHQYLIGSVSPRPIALVSTKDKDGNDNLAPYSFFNAFSSNPPILVFSSNRRVRDNTTKDTLQNVIDTKEVVVNMVNHDIVQQMAISSVEYPSEVSEFEKAGLTPVKSNCIDVNRVEEAPVNMECKVKEIITLGDHGGAGHLIICEVVLMHINEDVLDGNRIDPHKIDLMGRMGRSFYVRASGDAVETLYQSVVDIPVGYDGLPKHILTSEVLTAMEVAKLAGAVLSETNHELVETNSTEELHLKIQSLIADDLVSDALGLAMAYDDRK